MVHYPVCSINVFINNYPVCSINVFINNYPVCSGYWFLLLCLNLLWVNIPSHSHKAKNDFETFWASRSWSFILGQNWKPVNKSNKEKTQNTHIYFGVA